MTRGMRTDHVGSCILLMAILHLVRSSAARSNFADLRGRLRTALEAPVLKTWPFPLNFSTLSLLKLSDVNVEFGVDLDGAHTRYQLNRITEKALRGENISVLVLGGSSTAGADLGCLNRFCTFHYAVEAWWNRVIAPVTGSFMRLHVVAIGGVGTAYISHCWTEYLRQSEVIDLTFWEFGINDPDSNHHMVATERFVRSVLAYRTHPSIIFCNFFPKSWFPTIGSSNFEASCESGQGHLEYQNQVARYYNLTVITLFKEVCRYVKQSSNSLRLEEMFINHHPSHLAHAQMAFLLINYLKRHLARTAALPRTSSQLYARSHIPNALCRENSRFAESTCWTGVFPDDSHPSPHSLFQLPVLSFHGFVRVRKSKWLVDFARRTDVRGGYKAYYTGSYIVIKVPVPQVDDRYLRRMYVAYSSVNRGGIARFTVTHANSGFRTITDRECAKREFKAQCVFSMGKVYVGDYNLKIETLFGAVLLNAIIVE